MASSNHVCHSDYEKLKEELDQALARQEFTQQWYAVRIRRITDTAKREGIWEEVACILANGTGGVYEPPTYEQQLNMAKHRAEKAEAEVKKAKIQALTEMAKNLSIRADRIEKMGEMDCADIGEVRGLRDIAEYLRIASELAAKESDGD